MFSLCQCVCACQTSFFYRHLLAVQLETSVANGMDHAKQLRPTHQETNFPCTRVCMQIVNLFDELNLLQTDVRPCTVGVLLKFERMFCPRVLDVSPQAAFITICCQRRSASSSPLIFPFLLPTTQPERTPPMGRRTVRGGGERGACLWEQQTKETVSSTKKTQKQNSQNKKWKAKNHKITRSQCHKITIPQNHKK